MLKTKVIDVSTTQQLWTDRAAATALKFWRLGWRMGMGLEPIFKRHNVLQWDLAAATAAWRAAWRSVCLYLKDGSVNVY